jgi:hypothetical protein
MRTGVAVIAGAVLFTLPFQLYLHGDTHHGAGADPHSDHDARHGGTVVMIDDHHLEIVASAGQVEVYVSDALRRPLRPSDGKVTFDNGTSATLAWRSYRLVGAAPAGFRSGEYEVALADGTVLAIEMPRVGARP